MSADRTRAQIAPLVILFGISLLLTMFKGNMNIEASLGLEVLLTEVTDVLDSLNVGVYMLENV